MLLAQTLPLLQELRTLEHLHALHQNPHGQPQVSQAAQEAAHTCRLDLSSLAGIQFPMSYRLGSRPLGV